MPSSRARFDHGLARDALQNARVGRRREQHAVADQEDVVGRALGHFALVVEHQGFHAAGLHALDLGQDVVQVVERLDPRAERGGWLRSVLAVMISSPLRYSSSG